MLWWIIGALLVVWLLGILVDVGGTLLYMLLVAAAVVLLIQLVRGATAT